MIGACVRRPAPAQSARIGRVLKRLEALYGPAGAVRDADIQVWDDALAPGYGLLNPAAQAAIRILATREGLMLDPVYTAKAFAAIPALVGSGAIPQGSRVCFIHTGGLAAMFAYGDELGASEEP